MSVPNINKSLVKRHEVSPKKFNSECDLTTGGRAKSRDIYEETRTTTAASLIEPYFYEAHDSDNDLDLVENPMRISIDTEDEMVRIRSHSKSNRISLYSDSSLASLVPTSIDTNALLTIYDWVDSIPLSKVRKHLGRDFSDGVNS